MATNKNQHFVPRCYFRPFTHDGNGLAINLLNLDRATCITNAPVKHQCSGDYFYGQDSTLESAIQGVEAAYAAAVTRIHASHYKLSDEDREVVRVFILLQHVRTEAASRRAVETFADMETLLGAEAQGLQPSIKQAVQMAMRAFSGNMDLIDDLKIVLIRNRTKRPFVTSDDPAVLANRWYLQDARVRGRAAGIASAGALFFLPLSSHVVCLAYDGDVYSVPHEGGWSDAKGERDVIAFNEQQFLHARANIYFGEWADREWIHASLRDVSERRLPSRHRITYAVLDSAEDGYKRYRVVSDEEARTGDQEAIIHSEVLTPRPMAWPSQIRWRPKGWVYTNGTGAGYVRLSRAASTNGRPFRREAAFKATG